MVFHRFHGFFRETGEAAMVDPAVESEQLRCERLEILGRSRNGGISIG